MSQDKFYVITRLHKDDIREVLPLLSLNIDLLTDEDMEDIAQNLGEWFVEYGGYWSALEDIAQDVIQSKKQGNKP